MNERIKAYLELCKPRVVALMMLTAVVGMFLAPVTHVPFDILILSALGISLAAGAGGVINQLIDREIDAKMSRTQKRPLPTGVITPKNALFFALSIGIFGLGILLLFVNVLTAVLTFFTLIGYGVIYTVYLKRATPQNIVIGGLAGAMPPLLGWTAVTGRIDYGALLLVLIIFTWTPPHFWALAIARYAEYAKAKIPMLPVTHGVKFTKISIVLYTFLMFAITLLPFVVGMSGSLYLAFAIILGLGFLFWVFRLLFSDEVKVAMVTFRYSIFYLTVLFLVLLIDHYV